MGDSEIVVVYSDAARGDHVSGLGYVIEGEVSIEGCKFIVGDYTSMEAEYHALMEALRVAAAESSSMTKVEAYVDVEPLVTKMRVPDGYSQDWFDRRAGCHRMLNKFDDWKLECISRKHNGDAHDLARCALFEGREKV